MRSALPLTLLAIIMVSGPAQAQTLSKPDCTKANLESTDEKVGKMPDGPRKTTATSEMAAARKTFEAGQAQDCQDHLLKANMQTK